MKKGTVMMIVVLAIIALGAVCGADDKKGYVVKETFTFKLVPNPNEVDGLPWGPLEGSNQGRVYCANNDFVTGCSHVLKSYPGYTRPWDYSFLNVIPIECSPDLKDEEAGEALCRGCLVTLTINHPDPPPSPASPTDGTFSVYTYCSRPPKK